MDQEGPLQAQETQQAQGCLMRMEAPWGLGEIGVPGDSGLLGFLKAVGSPLAAVSPCAALLAHFRKVFILEGAFFVLTHCVSGHGSGTSIFLS